MAYVVLSLYNVILNIYRTIKQLAHLVSQVQESYTVMLNAVHIGWTNKTDASKLMQMYFAVWHFVTKWRMQSTIKKHQFLMSLGSPVQVLLQIMGIGLVSLMFI